MKTKSLNYFFIVLIFCSFISKSANSQDAKYQGALIYQFTRLIKWPKSSKKFTIAVVGNASVTGILLQIAKIKKVENRTIEIKKCKSLNEAVGCQILYIAKTQNKLLPLAAKMAKGKKILVISESPGLAKKGSSINFIKVGGKVQFELSKAGISNAGLVVPFALARIAVKVY